MPRPQTQNDKNKRGKRGKRDRKGKRNVSEDGIERKIVSIRRVTRVYKGGKRMRLSVLVVAGDRNGKVGAGIGKGPDVRTAEEKAYQQAKNNMVKINIKGNTIAHTLNHKKGAAKVFLKPAVPGTGVIAGGAMRAVVELAGIKDVLTKVLGTDNKNSNVYATIEALQTLRK
jgi:small subunit ribosomal protein S5